MALREIEQHPETLIRAFNAALAERRYDQFLALHWRAVDMYLGITGGPSGKLYVVAISGDTITYSTHPPTLWQYFVAWVRRLRILTEWSP